MYIVFLLFGPITVTCTYIEICWRKKLNKNLTLHLPVYLSAMLIERVLRREGNKFVDLSGNQFLPYSFNDTSVRVINDTTVASKLSFCVENQVRILQNANSPRVQLLKPYMCGTSFTEITFTCNFLSVTWLNGSWCTLEKYYKLLEIFMVSLSDTKIPFN